MSFASPGSLSGWLPAPATQNEAGAEETTPTALSLADGDVHLWFHRISLLPDPTMEELSESEQQRAERLRFERPRRDFVRSRGWLRRLLGAYLGEAPSTVAIPVRNRGKPFAVNEAVRFNLSHSGDVVLFAASRNLELGVDVERWEPSRDLLALARRYFSSSEAAELDSLPALLQLAGFYNGWTRKEAFIKAIGDGLSYPLDRFTVRLSPLEIAALLDVAVEAPARPAIDRWTLRSIDVGAAYSAAVVVCGAVHRFHLFDESNSLAAR